MDEYIGSKVAKVFPGYGPKPFQGKLKAVVSVKGNKYYRIRYSDGDEEDITGTELQTILVDDGKTKNKGELKEASKRTLSQPTRLLRTKAAAAAAADDAEAKKTGTPSPSKEELEEESFKDEGEKSPSPAAVASARARISSIITVGKKILTGGKGESEEGNEQEKSIPTAAADQEMEIQKKEKGKEKEQLSTEKEENDNEEEDQDEAGKEMETKDNEKEKKIEGDISPHEFLYSPQEKTEVPEAPKVLSRTHQEVMTIQRYAFSGHLPVKNISASAAVAANGFFSSEISPVQPLLIKDILIDLDDILKKVNVGKENLISVDVQFKDSAVGYEPFREEWNAWLGDTPAPAIKMSESFMHNDYTLMSLSAVAKLPTVQ